MKLNFMKNFLYLSLLLLSGNVVLSQSKVEQSKKELNSSSGSSSNSSSSNNSSNSSSSRSTISDDDSSFFVKIAGYVFFGVFKYGVIGDYKNEEHLYNSLTDYPYYNKESGNYENYKSADADSLKKNFRLDLQDHFLYSDKTLYGNHLKAKIRPFQYLYVQTDYHQLFEKNQGTGATDKLSLFYFNIGYDRIRFENINLGWTIGASYIGNEVQKAGFSFGVNTEVFMGHNISLLAAAKWSGINGKPVNVYELESKYHLKRYFVSLGYQHLKIATPTYNFISVGGGIYLN